MSLTLSTLKDYFQKHREEILQDFFTFLSFPSISADPQYEEETRKTAQWLCDYLQGCGLQSTIWETVGKPVVFAECLKAGPHRPTILIYHHYDVQPVDPLEQWKSDPFCPVIREEKVYARGASDNKGQCFYSIQAIKAFLLLTQKLQINIKVFIEGEEESGGHGTAGILPQKKEALRADYLLIVDMDLPAAHTPGITLGMRGITTMQIECSNAKIDLHSGMHGGIALNPNRILISALSKLWEASGKVAVPDFYKNIRTLSSKDCASLKMDFDETKYKKDFGVKAFACEKGFSPMESNWLRPTVEINGITGGYTGPGFKTVIPSKAIAKLSCRLVPDQDPEEIGEKVAGFIRSHVPEEVDLKIQILHGGKAFRSDFDSYIVKTTAIVYEEVFKKPCKYLLAGGSVPIVVDLAQASGAEVALIGMGLSEDNIHAPNEHFGLDRFELGFLTMTRILETLSRE